MKDEVRFSIFTETGKYVNSFNLDTFIRLFVNHRPVYGIGKNNIEHAFGSLLGGDKNASITQDELIQALGRDAECMGQQELQNCLQLLVGDGEFKSALPSEMNAEDFAQQVLGFEEIEDEEEEGYEGEGEDGEMM